MENTNISNITLNEGAQAVREHTALAKVDAFNFGDAQVRTVTKDGEAWFVAKDVCEVLGIANSRDATTKLDEDERDDVGITDAIGRKQKTTVVSEPGLYKLIFTSNKPEAKSFKRWVTHEVIPIDPSPEMRRGIAPPGSAADPFLGFRARNNEVI